MQLTEQAATAGNTIKASKTKVKKVILTPVAALATLVLKDGGAGGAVRLTLQAVAGGQSIPIDFDDGLSFGTDVHVILTGAGALAYIGY